MSRGILVSPPRPLTLERSQRLHERARALVPGVTHSIMKRPEQFAPGRFPVFLARGEGAEVIDVDGNRYVDFICGLGANSLGHRHPAVESALLASLPLGLLHSLPTEIELQASQLLLSIAPGADMVRFFKSGADATSAAVRLARALTGRENILTIGYNGWHDHFMFDTLGVPSALKALTERLPLFTSQDEPAVLERLAAGPPLAAVVLSVPYNRVLERDFVRQLRQACDRQGALLVWDEIVTGFRIALGGAQEFFDVRADLVCYSKALAAGMPLSAIAGPRRHLERMAELQVSTTFGGELLSLAACCAALGVYRDTEYIQRITKLGRQLKEGINAVAEQLGAPLRVRGYDSIPFFQFSADPAQHVERMRQFVGEMAQRGVLLRRDVNFICGAHTAEQIEMTIGAARESLVELRRQGALDT